MVLELTLNAHHEAAHAVIYERRGISVQQVNLFRCCAGCCHVSSDLPPTYDQLLAILAGSEADKVFLADDTEALTKRRSGWKKDLEDAESVFRQLDRSDSMEDAIAEAATLVQQNWHLIHSLAERWVDDSQESWAAGYPVYLMMGDDIRKLITRFLAEANDGTVRS
jgi:hypothetical protein